MSDIKTLLENAVKELSAAGVEGARLTAHALANASRG